MSGTKIAFVDYLSEDELREVVISCKSLTQVLIALGYSSQSGTNRKTVMERIIKFGIPTDHFTSVSNGKQRSFNEIFCENSEVTQAVLRRYYIKYRLSPYECAICGQKPEWCGKPLSLTLDHINGDNRNNLPSNLRWVCPNCDRQLPTFGSKNRRHM